MPLAKRNQVRSGLSFSNFKNLTERAKRSTLPLCQLETTNMRKTIIASITILALAGGYAATAARAAGSHQGGHAEFGGPGKKSEVSRTIEVVMRDNYFEPERIRVTAGETFRFVVKNQGEFVHEFNIGTQHMHAEHRKEMEEMVALGVLEADRINHYMMQMDEGRGGSMEHDDPNSVLLEPGKDAEIVWKFAKPMDLEFACNVPGHYRSGMAGIIEFVENVATI